MMAMKASIANTLLGLKKAGSTSCLAPPASGIGLASRSLPPSPCASRKVELNNTNLFARSGEGSRVLDLLLRLVISEKIQLESS